MFFFIGGMQPKTVTLDETPRLCPACGLSQAKLKRIDHYLSLFFIPLFRVQKGEPIIICDHCGFSAPPDQIDQIKTYSTMSRSDRKYCPSCGYVLESTFNYCPRCGTKV